MRHKICPVCGSSSSERAVQCGNCGASLRDVLAVDRYTEIRSPAPETYDFHYGETDLVESSLRWKGGTFFLASILLFSMMACAGVALFSAARLMAFWNNSLRNTSGESAVTSVTVTLAEDVTLSTNTPRPTLLLHTVTADAPPTRTVTPSPAPTDTPGPCMQEVLAGDSLIALVSRCGHRDMDVIDLVLEINNLSAPEVIQVGQTLEIPWPTATSDPSLEVTATPDEAAGSNPVIAFAPEDDAIEALFVVPTATLQSGVTWHRVVKDENIISIAVQYGADLKVLSELNPEIAFSQCDFGEFGGGPSCVVNVYEGQQVRVPAPTLTPTLSPTPSGSETPTPTPTATFNAPSAQSPGDRALFQRQDLVTLRWVASGTLAEGQVYRVKVDDLTAQISYFGDTTELFFIVPETWQGKDNRRHEYRWTVSVIDSNRPDEPYFSTEPRLFVWEAAE